MTSVHSLVAEVSLAWRRCVNRRCFDAPIALPIELEQGVGVRLQLAASKISHVTFAFANSSRGQKLKLSYTMTNNVDHELCFNCIFDKDGFMREQGKLIQGGKLQIFLRGFKWCRWSEVATRVAHMWHPPLTSSHHARFIYAIREYTGGSCTRFVLARPRSFPPAPPFGQKKKTRIPALH